MSRDERIIRNASNQEGGTVMECRRLRSNLLTPQYLNDSEFDTTYMHCMNVIPKVHIGDISVGQE
jgi:hypothetical protein